MMDSEPEADVSPSLEDLAAMLLQREGMVGMPESVLMVYTYQTEEGHSKRAFHTTGTDITLLGLSEWGRTRIEVMMMEEDEGEDDA